MISPSKVSPSKVSPAKANAHNTKGMALQKLGRTQEAINCYKLAIEANPDIVVARQNLGVLLIDLYEYDQALLVSEEAILLDPTNAEVLNNKGLALKRMDKNEEAIDCYKSAIEANPKVISARLNFSALLINLEKHDDALAILEETLQLAPNNPNVHNYKGIAFLAKCQHKSALECFEKATKLDGNFTQGYANKAHVEYKMELAPQSIMSLKKVTTLLRDKKITQGWNEVHVKLIRDCVDKLLELQSRFHGQAAELEKAVCEITMTNTDQNALQDEFRALQGQRDLIFDREFAKMQTTESMVSSPDKKSTTKNTGYDQLSKALQEFSEKLFKMWKDDAEFKKNQTEDKRRMFLEKQIQDKKDFEQLRQQLDDQAKSDLQKQIAENKARLDLQKQVLDLQKQEKENQDRINQLNRDRDLKKQSDLDQEARENQERINQQKRDKEQSDKDNEIKRKLDLEREQRERLEQQEKELEMLRQLAKEKEKVTFKKFQKDEQTNQEKIDQEKRRQEEVARLEREKEERIEKDRLYAEKEEENKKKLELEKKDREAKRKLELDKLELSSKERALIEAQQKKEQLLRDENDAKEKALKEEKDKRDKIKKEEQDRRDKVDADKKALEEKERVRIVDYLKDKKKRNPVNSQNQEEMKEIMHAVDLHEFEKIKVGWDKYKDISPELYDYTKCFYWTLINYFDAHRVENTDDDEDDPTEVNKVSSPDRGGTKILYWGAKLAPNLPIVKKIILALFTAVGDVFNKILSKKNFDRIKSINQIVEYNQDPDAQTSADLSKAIALAAQEIADRKIQSIAYDKQRIQDRKNGVKVQDARRTTLQLMEEGIGAYQMKYVIDKINGIIEIAKLEKIKLYLTSGGQEALRDVFLLVLYLTSDYDKIIQTSLIKKLHIVIADAVTQRKYLPILQEISQDLINKDIKFRQLQESKESDQSECCTLM